MSHGIAWIGEHSIEDPVGQTHGMRGRISLTAARGVDLDEFLISLGADLDELARRDLYRDRVPVATQLRGDTVHVYPAMYGTCGEWVYVLEDWGMATWFTGYRGVKSMKPYPDEEIVCLSANRWNPPSMIVHAPGDGHAWQAEFGEDTGCSSALDAALREAGAVYPSIPEATEEEVIAYREQHGEALPKAVFDAVGRYCGLSIDQAAVDAGDLPSVALPAVN
ncbi:hypothetical protein [Streptomyces sp. rh34]|uniref:hypothetical protein n=1 Tax=Streptomyces sp. rh34 TaxID=2034272 RepID=UPI001C54DE61|nr:hypothetical protein [Streptomyces sp. rh34]